MSRNPPLAELAGATVIPTTAADKMADQLAISQSS